MHRARRIVAEMLRSVVASFGYDVSLVSVVEHPEEWERFLRALEE